MTTTLAGRSALVTGAASGIGRAAAEQLAAAGLSKLILIDLQADELTELADRLSVETVPLVGDVAGEAVWREAETHFSDLDFAVLNAGISGKRTILDRLDFSDWRRVVGVNLDGTFLGLRASMKAMRAHQNGGAIVVTGSSAGIRTDAGMGAYGSSKAAVHHLVRIAANEGTKLGVRVNAVAPGGVSTPIWRGVSSFNKLVEEVGSEEAAFEKLGKQGTPLGKYTTAEEIAGQILFLLSDQCSTVTGSIFLNDGGFTL